MTDASKAPVLCFGEILWDSLPHGLYPGGAPVNVAYHLGRLGLRAVPVTAVGHDFLGDELLRRMKRWEMPSDCVMRNSAPTGVVLVELGVAGVPTFRIIEDVAWDAIELNDAAKSLAPQASAIIYGTLAQRCEHNRRELADLLERAPNARRIYDLNLRPPFDTRSVVSELAAKAQVIKLNHDELQILTDRRFGAEAIEQAARAYAGKTRCTAICVTAGERGAGMLMDDKWCWIRAQRVAVRDTVGSGDAFLASLTRSLLAGNAPLQQMLERACRLAEFVASCEGAMPTYKMDETGKPMKTK